MIRDTKVLDDMWQTHIARADLARQNRERETELNTWIANAETTIAELLKKVDGWRTERDTKKATAKALEKQSADFADMVEEKRQGTKWQPPAPVPAPPPSEPGTIFDQVSADLPRPERTLASAECKPPCSEHIVRDLLRGGPWVHFIGGRAECPGDGLATVAEPAVAPAEQTQPDVEHRVTRTEGLDSGGYLVTCSCGDKYAVPPAEDETAAIEAEHARHVAAVAGAAEEAKNDA